MTPHPIAPTDQLDNTLDLLTRELTTKRAGFVTEKMITDSVANIRQAYQSGTSDLWTAIMQYEVTLQPSPELMAAIMAMPNGVSTATREIWNAMAATELLARTPNQRLAGCMIDACNGLIDSHSVSVFTALDICKQVLIRVASCGHSYPDAVRQTCLQLGPTYTSTLLAYADQVAVAQRDLWIVDDPEVRALLNKLVPPGCEVDETAAVAMARYLRRALRIAARPNHTNGACITELTVKTYGSEPYDHDGVMLRQDAGGKISEFPYERRRHLVTPRPMT